MFICVSLEKNKKENLENIDLNDKCMKMRENINNIGVNWIFEKDLILFLDSVAKRTNMN